MMEIIEHSAITIVTALFTGMGVTMGTDLRMKLKIEEKRKESTDPGDNSADFIKEVFRREGLDRSKFTIEVNSNIPVGVGLKSSSAIMMGLIKGISAIKGDQTSDFENIKKSCEYSLELGLSYTGAMDDAVSVHIGGLNYVDNSKFELMDHFSLIPLPVVISIPRIKKRRIDISRMKGNRKESMKAFNRALKYKMKEAALINSFTIAEAFGYDMGIIEELSKFKGVKVSGFSGTGPAFYAIMGDTEGMGDVVDYFQGFGDYLLTRLR